MPLFYFDTVEGLVQNTDDTGLTLSSAHAARDIAVAMLAQVVVPFEADQQRQEIKVAVRDARGAIVLTVQLELSIEWTGEAAAPVPEQPVADRGCSALISVPD